MKMVHHLQALPLPAFSCTDLISYLKEEATKFLYGRDTTEAKVVHVTVEEFYEDHNEDCDGKNEPFMLSIQFTYKDDEHKSPVVGYSGSQSFSIILKAIDSFQMDFEHMITYRFFEVEKMVIGNGKKRNYYEVAESVILHLASQRLKYYPR